MSAPRSRGCFLCRPPGNLQQGVCPAFAGVFLFFHSFAAASCGLPRVRGGVSYGFSDCCQYLSSAPRSRGCFYLDAQGFKVDSVCPAFAGVFPLDYGKGATVYCLPRVRGGVSALYAVHLELVLSAPRSRGCFFIVADLDWYLNVCPAFAGVFLCPAPKAAVNPCLPRVRGGVSA